MGFLKHDKLRFRIVRNVVNRVFMSVKIQIAQLKYSDSHAPLDAPMPTTTEAELKAKKSSGCSFWDRKKVKHKHTLTRWEVDYTIHERQKSLTDEKKS